MQRSTPQNKKAFLEKLAKNKKKLEENAFMIPDLPPMVKNIKTPKGKPLHVPIGKTTVKTTALILKLSKPEKKMREFFQSLLDLTDNDIESNIELENGIKVPEDPLVYSGFEEFVISEVYPDDKKRPQWIKDFFNNLVNKDEKLAKKYSREWNTQSTTWKKGWIMRAYGSEKDAEFGRNSFIQTLHSTLGRMSLFKFINDYLKSDTKYSEFFPVWMANTGHGAKVKEMHQKQAKIDMRQNDDRFQHEPISKEDEEEINRLNSEIDVLKQKLNQVQTEIEDRKENLNSINRSVITDIVLDKKLSASPESESRDKLIELIIENEFSDSENNLETQISNITFKKDQLSSGKLIQNKKQPTILSDNEKTFLSLFRKNRRLQELSTWPHNRLVLFAGSQHSIKKPQLINKIQLIQLILDKEFPGVVNNTNIKKSRRMLILSELPREALLRLTQIKYPEKYDNNTIIEKMVEKEFPKSDELSLDKEEYRNFLRELNNEELIDVGLEIGMQTPWNASVNTIREAILRRKFSSESQQSKLLTRLDKPVDFNRYSRQLSLEKLSREELIKTAYPLGWNISTNIPDNHLIENILIKEEEKAHYISDEQQDKMKMIRRLSKITGIPENRYKLWTHESVKQRLEAMEEEEWPELEREQLLAKLGEMVDINNKDKDYKSWDNWQLVKELEKIGGPNWEEYQPLVENYEFTDCMSHYLLYKWIDGDITAVWLANPDGGNVNKKYISDETIFEDGREWYRANKKFFALQCNQFKNLRKQTGNVLTCVDQSGKKIDLIVGFTMTNYNGKYKPIKKMVSNDQGQFNTDIKQLKKQLQELQPKLEKKEDKLKSYDKNTLISKVTKKNLSQDPHLKSKDELIQLLLQYEFGHQKDTIETEISHLTLFRRIFLIQNEEIFQDEIRFLRQSNRSSYTLTQDLLDNTVNEEIINMAKRSLSEHLLEIAPAKIDYGVVTIINREDSVGKSQSKQLDYNTPYIQIVIRNWLTGAEQTTRDFLTRLAELLVYLKIPQSVIFHNRINNEYYLPDILATLSPTEKFPEVFEDPTASEDFKEGISSMISNNINIIVNKFGEMLYYKSDPTRRVSTTPAAITFAKTIKTKRRISACANKDRVNGVPSEKIIYYKEDSVLYCFSMDDLITQFTLFGDYDNPETGKTFDKSFVERFEQLYGEKDELKNGFMTDYFSKKYGFPIKQDVKKTDIISKKSPHIGGLIDIIKKDITELENELTNEIPDEGEEIDEKRETERRNVDEDTLVPQEDACDYCKKHLSNDNIKTLIRHGDESRIIKFCTFKCFEKKDDWAKFKHKKHKKAQKKELKLKRKVDEHVKSNIIEHSKKPKETTPVKLSDLSKKEIKIRQKKHGKKATEGMIEFDRMALPLLTITELRQIANEKGFQIPKGLSKEKTASFIFKESYPGITMRLLPTDKAKKEMETYLEAKEENKKSK